jgi:hypothetical protein
MSLLDIVFFALPFSGWLGATRATASNRPGACTPAPACVVGSQRPTATVSAQSILFSPTRTLAKLTKSQGANRGPNDDRLWATPGDFQPQSLQLNAPIGRNRATSRDGSNVPSKQRVAGSNPAGRASQVRGCLGSFAGVAGRRPVRHSTRCSALRSKADRYWRHPPQIPAGAALIPSSPGERPDRQPSSSRPSRPSSLRQGSSSTPPNTMLNLRPEPDRTTTCTWTDHAPGAAIETRD